MHSDIHESRFFLSNFHASHSSFSPYHASHINPLPPSIRHCLDCVHNCDDHGLLDLKTTVQYMKYFIYNFTSLSLLYKFRSTAENCQNGNRFLVLNHRDITVSTKEYRTIVNPTITFYLLKL